jgi:hypothetical protein
MLFRFWLMTSLVVAFVAYCGVFEIRLVPGADDQFPFASRAAALAVLDDGDGRGR